MAGTGFVVRGRTRDLVIDFIPVALEYGTLD